MPGRTMLVNRRLNWYPMNDSLARMLELSEVLEADLAPLFEHPRTPRDRRALLTLALCDVAMEFWSSQRLLIATSRQRTSPRISPPL